MALVLSDLEEFSYRQVADILEVPVGTVMSRLYRARKALEAAMLHYAREHGYLRGRAPAKMRSRR
jgi:RNA polymerase sigma-70 factor (ECF subfamily)